MDMHLPSDDELDDLPHMVLTSDIDWDPSILDNEMDLEQWLDAQMEHDGLPGINDYGDLTLTKGTTGMLPSTMSISMMRTKTSQCSVSSKILLITLSTCIV